MSPSTRHFASGLYSLGCETQARDLAPVCLSGAPPPENPPASTPPLSIADERFGSWHGGQDSRSAPVVRGPLRRFSPRQGCGPVASRHRTWGSLGFHRTVRGCLSTASERYNFPTSALPFEGLFLVGSRSRSPGSAPSSPFYPKRRCREAPPLEPDEPVLLKSRLPPASGRGSLRKLR